MRERLFVLQVVVVIEEQWFAPGTTGPPIRTERAYRIEDCLFAAADENAAYCIACEWVGGLEDQRGGGFADANHDGPGDLTRIFALGIHQLEEIPLVTSFDEQLHESYGVHLPGFYLGDVDADGVPLVRSKEELEVFRRAWPVANDSTNARSPASKPQSRGDHNR
jgi:hypothetical protein